MVSAIQVIASGKYRDPSIQHTAMVVSPLVSLMQDQQQHLSNIGISSTILSPSDVGAMLDVEKKPVSIVFCTPEALQTSAVRKLLMSKTFNKRLSLLACDEAHCISEWGESFRPEYRQIAIVRSLVDAPLLALTATATEQVQKDICQYLMIDDTAVCVAKLPDRPNIFLAIQTSSTPDCELELKWLKEAAVSRESMKKVIVFCRSYSAVYDIWSWLTDNLDSDYECRIVEMYHSSTDERKKEEILNEFKKSDSQIRILVCTVAFGMGVGINDVEIIIHWGAPKNTLMYWQEVGRAGRDGRPSLAIMYPFPRSLMKTITSEKMKSVVRSESCVRQSVLDTLRTAAMTESLTTRVVCPDLTCEICICLSCSCCSNCKKLCSCIGNSDIVKDFLKRK